MNFAKLQQAMKKGRSQEALPFSALDYLKKVDKGYSWVGNHFTNRDDSYLDVAETMFKACAFEEVEVLTDIVDMLKEK